MTYLHRQAGKGLAACVLASAIAMTVATPAWAHEEISPQTFRTGQPTYFTFSAANEKAVGLIKVTLAAPNGLPFGATTREPSGWTVVRTDQSITWSGGSVAPDHYEQWGFEVEGADQPGTVAYHATLTFADGTTDSVEVDTTAVGAPSTGVTAHRVVAAGSRSGTSATAMVSLVVALLSAALSFAALLLARRGPRDTEIKSPVPSAQDW